MVDEYDPVLEFDAWCNLVRLYGEADFEMHFEIKPQQRLFEVTIYPGGARFDFSINYKDAVTVTLDELVRWCQ